MWTGYDYSALCCRAEHVPLVFTPRFLRTLVNSFGHSDAHLHAAAKRLLEQVRAHAPNLCSMMHSAATSLPMMLSVTSKEY